MFLAELVRQHITPRDSYYLHENSVWLGGQDVDIEGTLVWTSSGGQRLSNDLRWNQSMHFNAVKCVVKSSLFNWIYLFIKALLSSGLNS